MKKMQAFLDNIIALAQDAKDALREGSVVEDHDWQCVCGHWNGANLWKCPVCGSTPLK